MYWVELTFSLQLGKYLSNHSRPINCEINSGKGVAGLGGMSERAMRRGCFGTVLGDSFLGGVVGVFWRGVSFPIALALGLSCLFGLGSASIGGAVGSTCTGAADEDSGGGSSAFFSSSSAITSSYCY